MLTPLILSSAAQCLSIALILWENKGYGWNSRGKVDRSDNTYCKAIIATNAYLSKSLEVYQIMKCTGHTTESSSRLI
jgi:hypothetical protein